MQDGGSSGKAIGLILFLAMFVASGCATTAKPGGIVVDQVTTTATVTAIDAARRTVTLAYPNGTSQSIRCSDAVKNFDQVRVGDVVKSTKAESVAIYVRKADEQPAAAAVQTVEVAPKGAKPGVVITNVREISARVEAIDYDQRMLTLRELDGSVKTIPVDQRVERFKNVKVGDEVVLQVTNAVMLAVEKP